MSNNIIDSIQLSGSSYDVRDKSATTVVEITQSDYDNLPSSAKTSNILYIITDGSVDYITSAQCQTQIDNSISGKQDTLIAGENITIVDNVISAEGGGGKAVSGGTNISITTGETADTINCTLNAKNGTGSNSFIANGIIGGSMNSATGQSATAFGISNKANGRVSFAIGASNYSNGEYSFAGGSSSEAKGFTSFAFGYMAQAKGAYSIAIGSYFTLAENDTEVALGKANVSHTGSTDADKTLFSVGNGTNTSNRHNAFEIRKNGDIYITSGNTDIKLQDNLGGGGASYSAGTGIDITNDVISVTGMTDSSAFTAHTANTTVHTTAAEKTSWNGAATNASNAVTALGGLSLVKLTQAQYDALATKDSNTLYVIVN